MPTIPELVERSARAYGPRIAVVDGDRRLTFAEVGDRSGRLANVLAGLTSEPGARVAILMRNRLEYVEADFAIARAGMVKVPINPRLSDDERRYLLADSGASVLITEAAERSRAADLVADLDRPPTIVDLDAEADAPGILGGYPALLGSALATPPRLDSDPERLSQLLYTSGTTGRPKGAMLADRCRVTATLMSISEEFCASPGDGMIHAGPLSHGSGSKVLTFFTRGARSILMAKFDPAAFFRCVTEQGGTSSFLVPTMIQMLVEQCTGTTTPAGLSNITYGGASISRTTLDAALETFGPILTQVFGTSEVPHPITALRHRDEIDPHLSDHPAVPTGRLVSAASMRLVDEQGPGVNGNHGELWVAGAQVMLGYWNNPAASTEALVEGWYRTGDVATVDDTGLITIVDRIKDMIISGGLNVYPAEVERVLVEHEGVRDVCVVGVPDDRWGEVVGVAVVTKAGSGLDAAALGDWCGERLAGYKKPRIVAVVDDLPKGSTAKISKRAVRQLLVDRAANGSGTGPA
ncbi:MAG TPA: AMP-binding protein [Acidimicrobiales bacterium]|jgi:acyl-CoA synthetase (AMP-forming)/AMP-acid ligase II|nr:AMP-binding protein [Acidimicrobiales bacterium]